MTDLIKAALAVAAKGLPVFPTVDKRPCWSNDELGVKKGEGGYKIATTDPDRIRELFSHRDAKEIAVPMGAMSGLICVDVDSYKDEGELKAWLDKNWEYFKGTLSHTTRSGGVHFIFKHPGDGYRFPSTLRAGVDLKAGGNGYVCWPGTEGYTVRTRRKPKAFPLALLEEAMKAKGGTGNIKAGSFNDATDEDVIASIKVADELYPALRTLSYRLPSRQGPDGALLSRGQQIEILEGVMDESDAKSSNHPRHEDWLDRREKIPDLVDSAITKREGPQFSDAVLTALQEGTPFMRMPESRPIGPQRETDIKEIAKRVAELSEAIDEEEILRAEEDSEFDTFTLDDLMDMNIPPIDWIIEGMLPAGGTSSLGGTSNVGKTRWLAGLIATLSVGRTELLGLPPCKGPTPTLWVANEEHGDDIKRRIKAAATHYDIRGSQAPITVRPKTAGALRLVALNEVGTPELDEENIVRLVEEMNRLMIGLLVLDPYVTLSDAIDENSAQSAAMLTKAFLIITTLTSAALLHAHHTPKDRSSAFDWYRGDPGAWRGSGAIYSALDCGFTLAPWMPKDATKRKEWRDNYLEKNLSRYIVLDSGKIREGKNIEPVIYELVGQELETEKYEIGVCQVTNVIAIEDGMRGESFDANKAAYIAEDLLKIFGTGRKVDFFGKAHEHLKGNAMWSASDKSMQEAERANIAALFKEPYLFEVDDVPYTCQVVVNNDRMKRGRYTLNIKMETD